MEMATGSDADPAAEAVEGEDVPARDIPEVDMATTLEYEADQMEHSHETRPRQGIKSHALQLSPKKSPMKKTTASTQKKKKIPKEDPPQPSRFSERLKDKASTATGSKY
jgi:hypothetical protein